MDTSCIPKTSSLPMTSPTVVQADTQRASISFVLTSVPGCTLLASRSGLFWCCTMWWLRTSAVHWKMCIPYTGTTCICGRVNAHTWTMGTWSQQKNTTSFFFPWPGSLKIVYGFLQRFRVKCQEIVAVADFSCSFPNPPVSLHSSRLRPEITSQINYLQACQSQAVLKRIETKPSRCAF